MNEEEFEECSVVAYPHEIRFLHIKGGRISYYVDRHISDYVNKIQQENQELKKQLEEINNFINKANFANIEQLMLDYCAKTEEQKEFIAYLENEIQSCELTCDLIFNHNKEMKIYKIILLKYKEIVGVKDE